MRRTRLFWKLFAGLSALSVLTAVIAGLLALPGLVQAEEETTERHLESVARVLEGVSRTALEGGDPAPLQRYVERLGDEDDLRVTVIRDDGLVLADTHHDPATMDDHAGRPEVVEARRDGRGRSARLSRTLGRRMLYVARRVQASGRTLGYVRAAQSIGFLDDRKAELRYRVAGAALLAVLISLGLALFISKRLTRPLGSLMRAAHAFAAGDYEHRVAPGSADELGRLGEAFNRMAGQLQERVDTISQDRAELRAVLRSMEEGVVAVDRDARIVLMNDAAGRILDLDPTAVVGEAMDEVLPLAEAEELLARAIERREPDGREVRLPAPHRPQCLQLHAAPLGGEDDPLQGAVLVFHDISALRHLENVRREFVANVSHELKTPLAAIRGFTETILEDDEMEADTRRRFLERVRKQVLRLAEMVDEVLMLSRLESDVASGTSGRTDLCESVRDVVQAQLPIAAEREIDLQMELPPEPVLVAGDAEGLRRILGNLVDNAVKYTPSGGWVRVRVRATGEAVVAEVEDNGIGIPEEARNRVFERFFRVDPGRSRAAGGTGLGLSIVKHLVAALGGEVEVEASPSGGSLFRVRLRPAPEVVTDP